MDKEIKTPGDGSKKDKPQKILFFVSDGVADANNPGSCSKKLTGGTRCQEPIDMSFCETIKKRGIKIAGLYTTYLPLPTNDWYNSWIKPFVVRDRAEHGKMRVAGIVFRGQPDPGHLGCDDQAVPEGGPAGAVDPVTPARRRRWAAASPIFRTRP